MAPEDHELVQQASAGSDAALTALLTRYGPNLRRRLHIDPVWRPALDPADIMQVTYLEAFLRVREVQARSIAGFLAWLTRLAQNNLRDAIRELERQKRPDPRQQVHCAAATDSSTTTMHRFAGPPGETPSHNAASAEARKAVTAALTRLPPDYAAVVRLTFLEDRAVPEAAAALGRSAGAVYMLRARALDRLRELLGSESRFLSDGA